MRVGVFFGGQSREREVSFAGGRTVYDNLNKALFEAVPIFVDSKGNLIHLDWKYIYKGTIRDFYPPASYLPESKYPIQHYAESLQKSNEEWNQLISEVGELIKLEDLPSLIDFAFLALHGAYGEDGSIQGALEWLNIPYSGAGILASTIGINKITQKRILQQSGFKTADSLVLKAAEFKDHSITILFEKIKAKIGLPFVVKSPNQGSSIGISIVKDESVEKFKQALLKGFFIKEIDLNQWRGYTDEQKVNFLTQLVDIREGIGLPAYVDNQLLHTADELMDYLNSCTNTNIRLEAVETEKELLIEQFIEGKEFSCIVIQDEDRNPIALPPTEIKKYSEVFDYRSKYLPGITRKITPIQLPDVQIESIRKACCTLYNALQMNVYARIDGFIQEDGSIYLNDPNTTSGMLPSSFFFHQSAEIGLNPSQFLTYIIRTSLQERMYNAKKSRNSQNLLNQLDYALKASQQSVEDKIKVGVFMGGFSSERHISVESGRNIYEKLSSSQKYKPVPIFLSGTEETHQLHVLPISIMLKDNADDIHDKIRHNDKHPILEQIMFECKAITDKYAPDANQQLVKIDYSSLSEVIDVAFIALHGRPGEDGAVQLELEKYGIPYNGSDVESSKITINKYDTNELLKRNNVSVADHMMVYKSEWKKNAIELLDRIEDKLQYPLIAKPADDGCSSAVKKIKNREQLKAFAQMMFRPSPEFLESESEILKLKPNEEFPQKSYFLLEELIAQQDATHFLEITGGLLTHYLENGTVEYEIFEPSEALATGEVLSLEEKFLAGEGQNITPARYTKNVVDYEKVASQVRSELKKVAKILNIQGYARIDAFVRIYDDFSAEVIIIEVNSLPGMTPATCIFHQSAINGYKPFEFIDQILEFGMKRQTLKA